MKKIIMLLLAALIISALSGCGGSEEEGIAVSRVKSIAAAGSIGFVDRYAGLVVSGESAEIKKASDKTIEKLNVAVGDIVQAGDILFTYDSRAMELQLEKLQLEYEQLQNKIASAEEEIPKLEEKLEYASATDQLGYKLQIQSLQADILESNYSINLKNREIASLQEAMQHTDVTAPISGRVMSVKEDSGSPSGDMQGSSDAFITITDVTTYRVKGTINELNVGTMYEGIPVLVRSRLNANDLWTGTLERIDWENTVKSNDNRGFYDSGSGEMTDSTKYPFYIALDDCSGLRMGQHVYIEPDYGQSAAPEGLFIPAYYLVDEGDGFFVWAQNSRGRLEKRSVETGETDETGRIQLLAGLTEDDYIAWPTEELKAGQLCTAYEEVMFGAGGDDMPGYYPDEEAEYMPEEYYSEEEPITDTYTEGAVG